MNSQGVLEGWRTIDSAPKDGTEIDLWVCDVSIAEDGSLERTKGQRVVNAFWGAPWRNEPQEPDTWVTNADPYAHPYNPSPVVRSCNAMRRIATHWQPLPEPPK